MSQFAREHPEDWQERLDAMLDAADDERKRQREAPEPPAYEDSFWCQNEIDRRLGK